MRTEDMFRLCVLDIIIVIFFGLINYPNRTTFSNGGKKKLQVGVLHADIRCFCATFLRIFSWWLRNPRINYILDIARHVRPVNNGMWSVETKQFKHDTPLIVRLVHNEEIFGRAHIGSDYVDDKRNDL